MNDTKLEPCPFCGEEGELATLGSYQRGVVCTNCGAQMSYSFDPESRLAIAAWNTRAGVPAITDKGGDE